MTDRDRQRVDLLRAHGIPAGRMLELGSGYGTTAAAAALAGYAMTAVEVSDRADFTSSVARGVAPGSLTVHKTDFYEVRLDGRFDAVCYWNGFGVGSDADQRRLLRRIGSEWLELGGTALIDVFNPFVWSRWDGDEEHRVPDAAVGYTHELRERIRFDPVTCTAVDTWWESDDPDHEVSQFLRCYTPADLVLLLEGTGMSLIGIVVEEEVVPVSEHPGLSVLLREEFEYLAVLRRADDGCPAVSSDGEHPLM
ncbi:methyltransferase domain-containing protein [Nocardia pseudovaccinii]|uniref:methyltransferase domain-containing protein n=1 Tax=Nocardia pseudovaccinii TaxID=189540 RepID=UPI003D919060